MRLISISLALMGLLIQQSSAVTWYFLQWYTPTTSAQFQSFSMQMVAPNLQQPGVYYLWPGLQDNSLTGVYQEVLDGGSGEWWIGPGCNPSLAWGSGFNVPNQDAVQISMTRNADGINWTSNLTMGSSFVSNSFPLAYKNFNQALLAIELYDLTWDFGKLVFNNVVMVVNTTATAWCTSQTPAISIPEAY
ncbi:uncharacterized protein K444DRAFT_625202 [Hyaloscypha bicolor E]|uniref:Uncharacterized protein n=1 Tax=Hyaloscypha bicolor E TaxID=1095630 RepID=A0A2J6TRN0_9HELO|nr:uncharacterized protein K444DRAFT_625202 [Hyaloscypha bicolor E]PMD65652.1 hypothetical protein K444DRAFT_625202 [Hyaloscypha bicolor E]